MYTLEKTKTYLKTEAKYHNVLGSARLARMEAHLKESPKAGASVRKIEGSDHLYRYRMGDFRVLYLVDDETVTILLLEIIPRGGAYKGL